MSTPSPGGIKVTFGSLEALSADIGRRVGSIENHIADLARQIQDLENLWQGGASTGFQATKKKWNDAADHLKIVLSKIQTAVKTSTDGYMDAENRNTGRWDQ